MSSEEIFIRYLDIMAKSQTLYHYQCHSGTDLRIGLFQLFHVNKTLDYILAFIFSAACIVLLLLSYLSYTGAPCVECHVLDFTHVHMRTQVFVELRSLEPTNLLSSGV